jgi:hypothetical protein
VDRRDLDGVAGLAMASLATAGLTAASPLYHAPTAGENGKGSRGLQWATYTLNPTTFFFNAVDIFTHYVFR